jgi:hypothetical protein
VQPISPATPLRSAPEPRPKPAPQARETALQLTWFEPGSLPTLWRDERFSTILDELQDRPLDGDLDDRSTAADVADVDDRREVFEILSLASAVPEEGVVAALAGAVRSDGRILQPIVLVEGELVFAFDPTETLKATMTVAAPYTGTDPEKKAILDLAKACLGAPGQPPAPAVAEGLATRIRETFEKRGSVPAGLLEPQITRAVLHGRHHQRIRLLGGVHVRALLQMSGSQPIPIYLRDDAAAMLPAADRIRARVLAVVHPALDQIETHPVALRAVAIGVVVVPLPRR